ncbi:hypothetical protein A3752_02270 [Oleiphilus sp. HI0081]|uniref:hypothetical protein n=1 Tax=unclassified Oleiphilus TaxID=2631174 RepID=UPI0007C3401D|nr:MULTISPECIES: hypothetical protein [unclassified Oleiphilus]KZY81440.1 hypothetical protein A3741_17280 [Oleiphilus sp. HI0069]KZY95856.1 hypothetical protein A3743_05085 [Oleiphilus sp. HI0072]KZZ19108.1 hypothetical protein A3752_02270 [Oleiphilus sp. HI0081]KZZ19929.1 hypothetical protein A3749_03385 [Oleiphilus sp. HI0078]KZZ31979.1 hypothetical protein A3755_01535 [Oleiphilus sp. HI0085]
MIRNLCLLFLVFVSSQSVAHNVLGGVYTIGVDVEGEIGFSNGEMAPLGSKVMVRDLQGQEIVLVETDEEGFFTFEATKRIDHHIYANLGAGHVFETVLKAEDLSDTLGEIMAVESADALETNLRGQMLVGNDLQALIEKAVAKQIKPLRKELNAYKEKASFRDALGGIGYIFGLCGIGIWLTQRNQSTKNKAS